MGTRSRIAVKTQQSFKSVYCHCDGYLEGIGKILHKHYDAVKANQLVALGTILSLKREIDTTTFFGRDHRNENCGYDTDESFKEFRRRVYRSNGEWYYVMRDGVWYVGSTYSRDTKLYNQLIPLADALEEASVDMETSDDEVSDDEASDDE